MRKIGNNILYTLLFLKFIIINLLNMVLSESILAPVKKELSSILRYTWLSNTPTEELLSKRLPNSMDNLGIYL